MAQRTVPLTTEQDRDNATDNQKKNGKDEDDGMSNLDEEVMEKRIKLGVPCFLNSCRTREDI